LTVRIAFLLYDFVNYLFLTSSHINNKNLRKTCLHWSCWKSDSASVCIQM